MLEFSRVAPHVGKPAGNVGISADCAGLAVGLARSWDEVEQAQRLRHDVFTADMGVVFEGARDGIDEDRFDRWCEHLLVREVDTQRVVGTYRILTPERARQAGGYYSESEFDLTGLATIREGLVEFGRSCTHEDYRGGSVIMLLWSGLAEFVRRNGYRHVLGCASVSLRDDGATAAGVYRLVADQIAEAGAMRVTPRLPLPIERLDHALPTKVPPLIKGYLKTGARVCGAPAWDPDFNAADFPVLLSVRDLDDRYRRRLGMPVQGA
jgi:putative hemolysin